MAQALYKLQCSVLTIVSTLLCLCGRRFSRLLTLVMLLWQLVSIVRHALPFTVIAPMRLRVIRK